MLAQFALFDGFDPLDVIAPFELLGAGGLISENAVRVELASAEGAREVPSGVAGVTLRASAQLDPEQADLIVVPGAAGRLVPADEAGTDPESVPAVLGRTLQTWLPALLKEALDIPGVTVATVCNGSLILAMAGLIDGRPATTHHLCVDALRATGAVAVDARVVDDGDLVTASNGTCGLDLALHLLEREVGPRVAHAVGQLFSHERRGVVWRPAGPVPAHV